MGRATQLKTEISKVEMQDLTDKVAVITGGTTGIGRATAILLAEQGVKVVFNGRSENELQDTIRDMEQTGAQFHGMVADNAYEHQIIAMFEHAQQKFGDIDILINNAALSAQSILKEHTYEDALYILRVNILGYLICIREAVKMMRRKGSGHIVNVGSMAADVREPGSDVYVATKGAIQAMSASFRRLLADENIRVSEVEPGAVGTNLATDSPDIEQQRQAEAEGQILKAEDIALVIYQTLILPPRAEVLEVKVAPLMQKL